MGYFPFFVDIAGRNGLIVGGGRVALHKLEKLLPYGARLTVVAPEITESMAQCAQENDICVIKRAFAPEDLTGMRFVIAASDDRVSQEPDCLYDSGGDGGNTGLFKHAKTAGKRIHQGQYKARGVFEGHGKDMHGREHGV